MGEVALQRHYGVLAAGVLGYIGRASSQASYTRLKQCRAEKNINADNDLETTFL